MECDQTDSLGIFLQEQSTYLLFQSTKYKTMNNSSILQQTEVAKQAVFDIEAAVFFVVDY